MIEHDLLHWAWGDRDRRAGLRVIPPPVQLPCVAEVLGVHLLRSLLHYKHHWKFPVYINRYYCTVLVLLTGLV